MSTMGTIKKAVTDIGKFLKEPSQATPIQKIGGVKCTALQQLVSISSEKKEMKWCYMETAPGVKTVDQRAHQDVFRGSNHS